MLPWRFSDVVLKLKSVGPRIKVISCCCCPSCRSCRARPRLTKTPKKTGKPTVPVKLFQVESNRIITHWPVRGTSSAANVVTNTVTSTPLLNLVPLERALTLTMLPLTCFSYTWIFTYLLAHLTSTLTWLLFIAELPVKFACTGVAEVPIKLCNNCCNATQMPWLSWR